MKNDQKGQQMTKTLTFLTMIAAKIMNKYEKRQKMTKTLTCFDMIAAKIMKTYLKKCAWGWKIQSTHWVIGDPII